MRAIIRHTVLASMFAGMASAAHANFTFSIGTLNTTLIPGKIVVPLYALNNGTGTLIRSFVPTFTANGGGLFVNVDDGGTPDELDDDAVDLPNAAGPGPTLTSPGNGKSYVRVGTAAQTYQATVTPGSVDPFRAPGGIGSFGAAVTTTATVNASSTVNGGLGFRVAVLVVSSTTTYLTLSGQVGGDVGAAQTITPQTFAFFGAPENIVTPSSVTVDVSPPGLESFSGVTVTGPTGTTANLVGTISAQIADNITIGGSGSVRTITGAGFTYADRGTYVLTFTAGTATGTFTLNVIPEPTTLAGIGMVGLVGRRARRR